MTEPLYANLLPRAQAAEQRTPVSLSVSYKQRLERLQTEQAVVRRQLLHALIAERSPLSAADAADVPHSASRHSPPDFAASTVRGAGGSRSRNPSSSSDRLQRLLSKGAAADTARAARALSATRARSPPQNEFALQPPPECPHCSHCAHCLPASASASAVGVGVGVSSPDFSLPPHPQQRHKGQLCSCRLAVAASDGAHLVPLSVDYAFGGSADAGSTDSGNASGGASAPNSNHSHLVSGPLPLIVRINN